MTEEMKFIAFNQVQRCITPKSLIYGPRKENEGLLFDIISEIWFLAIMGSQRRQFLRTRFGEDIGLWTGRNKS
jgi:hypothetical protein